MSKKIVQRRQEILSLVNEYGTIDFFEIRRRFPDVSEVTLRKDLSYLDETQKIMRTHGGAKSIPSALNYYYRSSINIHEKQEIAKKAAALINEGDSIFISAGTTCAELAKVLPEYPLCVCSDGVYTVSNIANQSNISVELLGGEVDLNIMRVEGPTVLNRLENKHFSLAFIGAFSIHPELGFSHGSSMTTAILERVIENSEKNVVLADSEKFNFAFTQHRIPLEHIDCIVTDGNIPKEYQLAFQSKGITVI